MERHPVFFEVCIFACIASSGISSFSTNSSSLNVTGESPSPISNSSDNSSNVDILASPRISFGSLHSLANLSLWASYEETISKVLRKRLEFLKLKSELITDFLEDYRNSTEQALEYVHEPKLTEKERGAVIGSSAVLSHRMITRYTSSIKRLKSLLSSQDFRENQGELDGMALPHLFPSGMDVNTTKTFNLEYVWPSWKDKHMSSQAFLHLQEVYGYLPEDLQYGPYFDTTYGGELNAGHCAEIGVFALRRSCYYMAVDWLEHAKSMKVKNDGISETDGATSVLLNLAIQENNFQLRYLGNFEMFIASDSDSTLYSKYVRLYTNLYNEPYHQGMREEEKVTGRNIIHSHGRYDIDKHSHQTQFSRYIDICMGFENQDIKIQFKLKCYYENSRHPYLYINPVKAEQLSESPPIYQFYEMVGDSEIERIKRVGESFLHLSSVVGHSDYEEMSNFRTSASTGLLPEHVGTAIKLAEVVSGLKIVNSSHLTQYVEYTYGRYYTYHADWFYNTDMAINRVATILYYLELPELGGHTPFCDADVAAHPIRGSAILWYNMYRNGSVRDDVNHGACPVVHGRKIVMNHWLLYGGNFQHFPCTLNPME